MRSAEILALLVLFATVVDSSKPLARRIPWKSTQSPLGTTIGDPMVLEPSGSGENCVKNGIGIQESRGGESEALVRLVNLTNPLLQIVVSFMECSRNGNCTEEHKEALFRNYNRPVQRLPNSIATKGLPGNLDTPPSGIEEKDGAALVAALERLARWTASRRNEAKDCAALERVTANIFICLHQDLHPNDRVSWMIQELE